jgi:ketosteroid isomerase-like protein
MNTPERPERPERPETPEHGKRYEIRIMGALDVRWSAWFAGLDVAGCAESETTLTGRLRDQAELHGVLARVRDLGLPLIAVRPLEPDPDGAEAPCGGRDPREGRPQLSDDRVPELVRRWAEAESRSDADALDALMADDVMVVGPRGVVLDRRRCLERYRSGALRTESFAWSDVRVREYGPTAVVVGVVTRRATYRGRDTSGRFRVTQIAVRQEDGRWRCAGLQFSGPIPE